MSTEQNIEVAEDMASTSDAVPLKVFSEGTRPVHLRTAFRRPYRLDREALLIHFENGGFTLNGRRLHKAVILAILAANARMKSICVEGYKADIDRLVEFEPRVATLKLIYLDELAGDTHPTDEALSDNTELVAGHTVIQESANDEVEEVQAIVVEEPAFVKFAEVTDDTVAWIYSKIGGSLEASRDQMIEYILATGVSQIKRWPKEHQEAKDLF